MTGMTRRYQLWCVVTLAVCAFSWQAKAGAQVPSAAPSVESAHSLPDAPSIDSQAALPAASLADSLQGQAKADYEAARLLYDSGDYAGALLKFQSAYQAAGDPRLLWNAAGCERNLHSYAKAIVLVRQFLASESPLITPELASRAQAFLAAALPLTAPLEIESSQPNSEVYLDDELLGPPALASQARIDLGTHRLVVTAHGYQPYTATLTVVSSATLHVTAMLRPLTLPLRLPPAEPHPSRVDHHARASALPTWVWVASGGAVLAGIVTASYFILRPSAAPGPVPGSIATLQF